MGTQATKLFRWLFPKQATDAESAAETAAAFEATFEIDPPPAATIVSLLDEGGEACFDDTRQERRTVTVWIGDDSFEAALV